ncbi:MAG TPA: SpoIIE family protein phosphatase [Acidimicrobiia bacterium]|nr:SpoIIE family protein phosphatase [Acidimicrobiia bacterium]
MSLRRRLLLVSLVYLVIVVAGGAMVLRISTQRDNLINDQRALVADAPLNDTQQAELRSTQNRLDELRVQLNATIGIVLGLAFATTLVAAFLTRRWVTRPVERLARSVRRARAGKVGVIAPQGPPEIADLARDVDAMRLQMNRALFDAVRARETIEQSASVVLQLRSELASGIDELPEGWTVAAQLHPAEGVVAGDCYDVIDLGPSALGLVVVDISGHGAVSGILALRCKELLRAGLREGLPPNEALLWAAEQLDDLGDETFLTAFVAVVDLGSGAVTYASAGHPPALLCSASEAAELAPTGPIVGPFVGPWDTASAHMQQGDRLAVYTDGLIEIRDEGGSEFGVRRLSDLVCEAANDEAEAIVKRCVDEVTTYAPARLRDDVTIALLCRGPREPTA